MLNVNCGIGASKLVPSSAIIREVPRMTAAGGVIAAPLVYSNDSAAAAGAHHAHAADLLHLIVRIGDDPMAADQPAAIEPVLTMVTV